MRIFSALSIVMLGLSVDASAQTCTGLCLQQTTCSGNATTSVTGVVYAPNGTDPLPNVTVYIPNAPVAAFTPGVTCDVVGAPPSGSPLVGTTSAVDGTFTIDNMPVGTNIPLVIVSGKWRRQVVIPSTTACTNTPLPASLAVMPQNQTQGDIPKIAIATGAVDQVECILRKVGINDSEFTDPSAGGRINFFTGSGGAGATIDAATPTQASLMENASTLNNYDVLMLPCQSTPNNNVVSGALGTQELANFINFANAGGRVYASHFSYAWMYNNPPFNGVANWDVDQTVPSTLNANGTPYPATVNTSFTAGQTLAQWLQLEGASTTLGQIGVETVKHDMIGVIAPTQSWMTLNEAMGSDTTPVMQMVFDTPIAAAGTTVNQCGRVLYNEYHVENGSSNPNDTFPSECSSTTTLNPQEKLLEYMLFELTDEGGQPSLSPTTADFGSEAVSYTTAAQTFTWTNNSSFPATVSSVTITGSFAISANTCNAVAAGASCTIGVTFTPQSLGTLTGTLTVTSSGNSLTAALSGTGVPGFSFSASSLSFGNVDIGASAVQTLTLSNVAPVALTVPVFATTGNFAVSTTPCGTTLAAGASCTVNVTFNPTTTGPLTGTIGVNSTSLLYSGLSATLSGNGVDFSLSLNPASGTVIAGDSTSTTATLTPIAGFAAQVTLGCTFGSAQGATCGLATASVMPTAPVTTVVSIATTSQYVVIGYGGFGGGWMWIVAAASGCMLWVRRKTLAGGLRRGLLVGLAVATCLASSALLTGCTGKLPAQNAVYTGPGSYSVTVSATDGFLVRTATYKLTVTSH